MNENNKPNDDFSKLYKPDKNDNVSFSEDHLHTQIKTLLEIRVKKLEKKNEELNEKLNEIEENWNNLTMKEEKRTDSLIQDIFKNTSLYQRFKIYLEMEFLNGILEPNTCCTKEEFLKAEQWSKKVSNYLVKTHQSWSDDNAPLYPDEDTSLQKK